MSLSPSLAVSLLSSPTSAPIQQPKPALTSVDFARRQYDKEVKANRMFSRWISEKWVSGERLLLAAILHRAVLDAVLDRKSSQTERRRISEEARRWIYSDSYSSITSFVNICEVLELDPGWVRNKVEHLDPAEIGKRKPSASASYDQLT
jgi:hypothetical protein